MSELASLYDANVWLALTFTSHPAHGRARGVFAEAKSSQPAAFCRATEQTFLRLVSTPAVHRAYGSPALTNRDALRLLSELQRLPQVTFLAEPGGIESIWHRLAGRDAVSPKLWMDAYLAAFSMAAGALFVTLDDDFNAWEAEGLMLRRL